MTDSSDDSTNETSGDREAEDSGITEAAQTPGRDWRNVARTWGSRLGLVVLVLIVVPFAIYAVPQAVGANHSYVVLSGSMEPAIGTGDAVLVQSVDPQQIETGDVITFGESGDERPTTHRVIGVNEGENGLAFETKGDNNEDPDASAVPAEQVEGTVMSFGPLLSIPLIGYVINFTGTPIGFAALFVVPVSLLILNEVWNVVSGTTVTETGGQNADGGGSDASVATAESEADQATGTTDEGSDGDSDSDAVTFSAGELQLGLVILTAFTGYSLWVSYSTLEVWSFIVSGCTLVSLLLLGGLYAQGRFGNGSDEASSQASDASEQGSGTRPESSLTANAEANDD